MNSEFIVYTINGSCADAVVALCAHLQLSAELREREHHDAELTRINPARTVPTLATPDGLVLTETAAILNHIARLYAGELLGRGVEERARNEEMLGFLSTAVYNAFLLHFRPDRSAASEAGRAAVRASARSAIETALDALAARVSPRGFALGADMTTSDFLLLVMLNWAGAVDPALLHQRPVLAGHLDRLRAMPFHARAFGVSAA